MARERGNQHQQGNLSQGSAATTGKTSGTRSRSEMETERGEREREIETGRERGTSTSMSRQPAISPVFGPGTSPLIAGPFALMRNMAEDMDRLFENFGLSRTGFGLAPSLGMGLARDPWREPTALTRTAWSPQLETFRRGDKLVVRADLPGLRKEDVNVEVDNGVLAISGERSDENEEQRDDFYRSERSYGQFYRAIPLPDGIDENQCEATFKDGVLEVILPAPKMPERKTRQIQIR